MKITTNLALSVLVFVAILPSAGAAGPASAQPPVLVTITRGAPSFSPDTITVVIGVNNTVTWMNNDTSTHTVTPNNPPGMEWTDSSGNLFFGFRYSYTFTVPGIYGYICSYHSFMVGEITVKAAPTPTPEFPAAGLPVIFFAVIALLLLAAARPRTGQADPRIP